MRKIYKLIILLLAFSDVSAQTENCLSILVKKKGYTDIKTLTEFYNPNGLYLLQDGIYNFKINGKKYEMYRIVNISKDSLTIVFGTEDQPLKTFPITLLEKLTFYSLDNGRVGFPHNSTSSDNYEFVPIQNPPACRIEKVKIYKDKTKTDFIEGYNYLTDGYGWKPVYKENGKTLLLDKSMIHYIKNK